LQENGVSIVRLRASVKSPLDAVTTDASAVARYLYHITEPAGVYTVRCGFAGDAWVEAGYGEATLTVH
jgi:hypothetical protein